MECFTILNQFSTCALLSVETALTFTLLSIIPLQRGSNGMFCTSHFWTYSRLASFKFAFQPMGHRVFKAKKKVREVINEEESIEIWRRRKNKKNSYINPNKSKVDKVFEKFKFKFGDLQNKESFGYP